jgi:hypothetical protein
MTGKIDQKAPTGPIGDRRTVEHRDPRTRRLSETVQPNAVATSNREVRRGGVDLESFDSEGHDRELIRSNTRTKVSTSWAPGTDHWPLNT